MTKKINVYFLLFFLASFVFLFSKSSGAEIDNLFISLKNASDVSTAKKYEEKIWEYWLTSGSNQNNNTLMTKGVKLMKSGQLDEALNLFIDLSKSDPNWAEPINKIATIRYLQGDFYGSIRDIQSTLKIEPRHFGAIAGLAQINLALGRYNESLKNLDFAINIHPFISIKNLRPILMDLIEKSEI